MRADEALMSTHFLKKNYKSRHILIEFGYDYMDLYDYLCLQHLCNLWLNEKRNGDGLKRENSSRKGINCNSKNYLHANSNSSIAELLQSVQN